jgi:hypothetical protein
MAVAECPNSSVIFRSENTRPAKRKVKNALAIDICVRGIAGPASRLESISAANIFRSPKQLTRGEDCRKGMSFYMADENEESELMKYREMADVTEKITIVHNGYSTSIHRTGNQWWVTFDDPEAWYDTLPEAFAVAKEILKKKVTGF